MLHKIHDISNDKICTWKIEIEKHYKPLLSQFVAVKTACWIFASATSVDHRSWTASWCRVVGRSLAGRGLSLAFWVDIVGRWADVVASVGPNKWQPTFLSCDCSGSGGQWSFLVWVLLVCSPCPDWHRTFRAWLHIRCQWLRPCPVYTWDTRSLEERLLSSTQTGSYRRRCVHTMLSLVETRHPADCTLGVSSLLRRNEQFASESWHRLVLGVDCSLELIIMTLRPIRPFYTTSFWKKGSILIPFFKTKIIRIGFFTF
jgi:hypothetical protein